VLHAENGSTVVGHAETVIVNSVGQRQARTVSAEIRSSGPIVGRQAELVALRAAFTEPERATAPVVRIVTGLGGMGKSTVARAYATLHEPDYGLVWWVRAQDHALVEVDCRALLQALAPEQAGHVRSIDDPVHAVHTLLANRVEPWLLVLDNAINSEQVRHVIPAAGPGDVLITSQASIWPDQTQIVPLQPLAVPEAATLLTTMSGDHDRSAAEGIARELDGLPLALVQAASYVRMSVSTSLAGYLDLYRARRAELHREGVAPDYDKTVATTWTLAFEALDAPARAVLSLIAWCAPDEIPIKTLLDDVNASWSVFGPRPGQIVSVDDMVTSWWRSWSTFLHSLCVNPIVRDAAVRQLLSYSLVGLGATRGAISIHRLVQAVTMDRFKPDEYAEWRRVMAAMLLYACPAPPATGATLARWRELYPHILAMLERLPDTAEQAHDLRAAVTAWAGHTGRSTEARDELVKLVQMREASFGKSHPLTFLSRNNLALWTGQAGDPVLARDQFAALVEDMSRARVLRKAIYMTRNNHATWVGTAGDSVTAQRLLEELLGEAERALGTAHPDTLLFCANHAYWVGQNGDPDRARDLYARTAAYMANVCGLDHPEALAARNNLGFWTGVAGDAPAARRCFTDLLRDETRVFGPDHPTTLSTMNSLAHWTGRAGDPAAARNLYAGLVVALRRLFGADDQRVLESRAQFADWTGFADDAHAARELFADLLADRVRLYGPHALRSLLTKRSLAHWAGVAGDPAQARDLLTEVVTDSETHLGADHAHTKATRQALENWEQTTN
jgi:hypothetical protein